MTRSVTPRSRPQPGPDGAASPARPEPVEGRGLASPARPEPVEGRAGDGLPTIRQTLRRAAAALATVAAEEAALEADLLLAHALRTDRAHLYASLDEPLAPAAADAFERLLERRLAHEPAAYILGRREFYGLDLEVTPAAIIPRPETETLVDLVLAFARTRFPSRRVRVADVGTGSGAIAVALAVNLSQPPPVSVHPEPVLSEVEGPNRGGSRDSSRRADAFSTGHSLCEILAIDLSREALALARRNAKRHNVASRIRFLQGDLLEPLSFSAHPGPVLSEVEGRKPGASRGSSRRGVDVIAANLPYVPTAEFEAGPPEIREHAQAGARLGEPRLGLDGGPDGLRLIERLLQQAPEHLAPGGALFAEIGDTQGPAARELAARYFPGARVTVEPDLAGLDRVLAVRT